MRSKLLDISQNLELWDETIQIYRDSFDEWEREDEATLLKHIKHGSYKMFAYQIEKEIVGFYILDINTPLQYALFSFLAIKKEKRGLGLGSKLCLEAIEYFFKNLNCSWFFIEAEERQAKLYSKLGFKALDIDYRVPAFNSQKSIKMSLMLLKEQTIDRDSLLSIIKDIFIRGYGLNKNDIRLEEQLQRIQHDTRLS
ncbi:MAG: GNAT family N-acetyltransferase [Sulfurimonas sp.]|nr:GNAT family N-acetyltransferase [Sulfurimonas sp.]